MVWAGGLTGVVLEVVDSASRWVLVLALWALCILWVLEWIFLQGCFWLVYGCWACVLGCGCYRSSFLRGDLSQVDFILGRLVGAHLCGVGFVCAVCFGGFLLRSVLCCMPSYGGEVVVLCGATLANVCGCCGWVLLGLVVASGFSAL
ncbi:hypothetical protein XENOCAPTIV_011684 [Xenoophorus captivus]|uniref:NADH dehydrogenase subunit 6 n=1 Tax=Xenoophorus captivus TaxID=1517983 RepID=A0ABV0SFM8_9TELE